ncbi:hypothetical protein ACIU3Q_005670 [Salmonella enterica subsp. enterica serovar Kokomlemle]
MKIEFQEGGIESRIVITSWFLDWQAHNSLVSDMLFSAPQLRAVDNGFIRRDTVISGKTPYVMVAEIVAEENGYEVRRVKL